MRLRFLWSNIFNKKMNKHFFLLLFLFGVSLVNSQSVKINSLKINEKITFFIDFDKLKKANKIDSITPIPELMDMSIADSLVFIGNTYFDYYKKTNSCILGSIIFDDKVKSISLNSYIFDKNTTIEYVKKLFPKECAKALPISIYGDTKKYLSCSINLISDSGEKLEYKLLFFFFKNKITRIDFWEPS